MEILFFDMFFYPKDFSEMRVGLLRWMLVCIFFNFLFDFGIYHFFIFELMIF